MVYLLNYYAFKLVETKRRAASLYELHRYAVIDGVETAAAAKVRIPVPGHLPNQDDFNRRGWYALHSRLPHILWLADPPTAHVLYHL